MASAGWRAANALIPPNVFPFEHDGLAAKYAVLSEADFHRLNGPETRNVSVWARFAQPSRLVWAADEAARGRGDRSGCPRGADPARGRSADGRAEPIRCDVAARLCADLFGRAARRAQGRSQLGRGCRPRALPAVQRRRRSPQIAEPSSAADGAAGGSKARCCRSCAWPRPARPSPAASIISPGRSTGTPAPQIEIKPWQRRWPLLAAISLLPRLLKSGAIR